MTPAELKATRHALGLTADGLAALLMIASGRTIRKWEAGDAAIPGPAIVLLRAIMANEAVRDYFSLTLK